VVHAYAVPSGVSDQPMSDGETKTGAAQRALNACAAATAAGIAVDFAIGLEGGCATAPPLDLPVPPHTPVPGAVEDAVPPAAAASDLEVSGGVCDGGPAGCTIARPVAAAQVMAWMAGEVCEVDELAR